MLIIGRRCELAVITAAVQRQQPILILYGQSGIGKTRLIEAARDEASMSFDPGDIKFFALYRTAWSHFLAEAQTRLPNIPAIANQNEIETGIFAWARNKGRLLLLDNIDEGNIEAFARFAERWIGADHSSTLLVTCQTAVHDILPAHWPSLQVGAMSGDDEIKALLGSTAERFSLQELRQVATIVHGNPQSLRFLEWVNPKSVQDLNIAAKRVSEHDTSTAIEDLLDHSRAPFLFFLALGIHRDANIDERLLANLWDHFCSRGAEAFTREVRSLETQGFLLPAGNSRFRLHESVHVALPKVLRSRVGEDRIPSLHHYFAEYYRRILVSAPTSEALTNFVFHAKQANNAQLLYDCLIGEGIAQRMAARGSTYQVIAEVEPLGHIFEELNDAKCLAHFHTLLGRLHNDLSQHAQALASADKARGLLGRPPDPQSIDLQRQLWYIHAVAYSNTGQSKLCRQNYAKIVRSSFGDRDELSCLCLGYLGHDVKYDDLSTGNAIGSLAVDWARSLEWPSTLAKNLCSVSAGISLSGDHEAADIHFNEATLIAESEGDERLKARIQINHGFARILNGKEGVGIIREGIAVTGMLGDRRRHSQGILFEAIALCVEGACSEGKAKLLESANALCGIGDGRYFSSALCWLLQLADLPTTRGRWGAARELKGYSRLIDYAEAHPEFMIYESFWERNLQNRLDPGF